MEFNLLINFGQSNEDLAGRITIDTHKIKPEDLHEYVIAPSYQLNEETKQFDLLEWSLIHRTHVSKEYAAAMADRERQHLENL